MLSTRNGINAFRRLATKGSKDNRAGESDGGLGDGLLRIVSSCSRAILTNA